MWRAYDQRMIQKRYPLVILVVLILGVIALFHYGQSERTTVILEPQVTESLDGIGSTLYKTLAPNIEASPVTVFGVSPTEFSQGKLIEDFLASAAAEQKPYAFVIRESQLPAIKVPEGTEVIEVNFNSEPFALAKLLREKTEQSKRVLIHSVNIFTSYTLKENPIQRLEQEWGSRIPAITVMLIGIAREQEFKVDPPCVGTERDGQGTSTLGCAALHKQRSLYRRGFDVTKTVSMVDEQSPSDYLVFLYQPKEVPKN